VNSVDRNGLSSDPISWYESYLAEEAAGEAAQPSYDPLVDLRDYAKELKKTDNSDCLNLALLAFKAGQVSERNHDARNEAPYALLNVLTEYYYYGIGIFRENSSDYYRVGVRRSDRHYDGGFGQTGFSSQFLDRDPASQNQVRHFAFWFAVGFSPIPGEIALARLYEAEGTSSMENPDVALGVLAYKSGAAYQGDYRQTAQDIWHTVCGESSNLDLK